MRRSAPPVPLPEQPGGARVRAVTALPGHHSFGYYDKCPWDVSGRYLLALRAPFCDRSPEAEDVATLGLVDLHEGDRFRPFAETRAWNWQQGCMLHWLRAPFGASPAGAVPPGEGTLWSTTTATGIASSPWSVTPSAGASCGACRCPSTPSPRTGGRR